MWIPVLHMTSIISQKVFKWNEIQTGNDQLNPDKSDRLEECCKKYTKSISHGGGQGGFNWSTSLLAFYWSGCLTRSVHEILRSQKSESASVFISVSVGTHGEVLVKQQYLRKPELLQHSVHRNCVTSRTALEVTWYCLYRTCELGVGQLQNTTARL